MKIFKDLTDYEKIMQVLDLKGIKPAKAERLGGSTISKLKQRKGGDGSLHDDNLEKFLRTFRVNPIWWETGQGEMLEKDADDNSSPVLHQVLLESIKGINKLLDENHKLIDDKKKEVERLDKDKNWAFTQLEKLHDRLGVTKDSQQ
jgi:phage repressor protein C with HTH and peptisase S24 domain